MQCQRVILQIIVDSSLCKIVEPCFCRVPVMRVHVIAKEKRFMRIPIIVEIL